MKNNDRNKSIYLNHASITPLIPAVQNEIINELKNLEKCNVSYIKKHNTVSMECKKNFADLINSSEKYISIQPNVATAFSWIAQSGLFKSGDQICLFDNEYPSASFPFLQLEKIGVKIVWINYNTFLKNQNNLDQLLPKNIKAIIVSPIGYMTGISLNLKTISNWCKKENTFLFVDATQSIPMLEINIQHLSIDFLVTSTYKWLCGLNGIALCYISDKCLNQLTPIFSGCINTVNPYTLPLNITYKDTAECMEPGGKSIINMKAALSGLSWLQSYGLKKLRKRMKTYINALYCELYKKNISFCYDYNLHSPVNIICIEETNHLYNKLKKNNIIFTNRQHTIRLSPYIFNSEQDIKSVIDAIN